MANEDAHRKQIKEEKKKMEYNMNILNNIMMGGGLYEVLPRGRRRAVGEF